MTTPTPPDDAFFQSVRQQTYQTEAGPCELPILYWGASLLGLSYRVDPAKAAALLPDAPFEPMVVFGKAVAMLCLFEYRDTSIGPYNEIGLAIQCKRKGTRPSLLAMARDLGSAPDQALYILNLPVTTEGARAAGVGLWSYPKYVTGIETHFGPDEIRVTLEGELTVKIGKAGRLTSAGFPFVMYSLKDGKLLRTHVPVDHRVKWGGAGTADVQIIGDGPTAKSMRALGLDGAKPLAAFRTNGMRSILPIGEVIATLDESADVPKAKAVGA